MRPVAHCHTEMARELAALWAAVSSAMESVLERSPSDIFRVGIFRVGVVGLLFAEFQNMEEW
jgi:hypothetical protein